MTPSHAIVIPVHNRAGLTRRCLDTLLSQEECEPAELIVVDDGSTDPTPELLAGYGERLRVVRPPEGGGFAEACNAGAAATNADLLVFLNNDTRPRAGWLRALLGYAATHRRAAVVGSLLLFPNGTVQHAGVVFGQDGWPRHLYAGLPAGHPAVLRPRRLQAVTAACMLIRRAAFEDVGGFDPGFRNSLEDVDLCLRVGQLGHEIHLCPDAMLEHLESASRGRLDRYEASVTLYRERWRDRVRRDDLEHYLEDGLLKFQYGDSYPLTITVSPHLAVVDSQREQRVERLLDVYSRETVDLLREVVSLTAQVADPQLAERGGSKGGAVRRPGAQSRAALEAPVRERLFQRVREIEDEIYDLQVTLAATLNPSSANAGHEPEERAGTFTPSRYLGYRRLLEAVREAVVREVPRGATVLVASRGDPALLELDGQRGWHFPRADDGGYAGHYPADGAAAIEHLEKLRSQGAEYLVLPATALWWLDHYREFDEHLESRYHATRAASCTIFALNGEPGDG
jgi:GT2 family glycosyltransferase